MFASKGSVSDQTYRPDASGHWYYKIIAARVVGQNANVKKGNRVVLRGDVRDLDPLEELSFAASLNGCTLTIDGKTVVDAGKLKTP